MNLFYEDYPRFLDVHGEPVALVTDFREYIKLLDMLKDKNLSGYEKIEILSEYFLTEPDDLKEAVYQLTRFVTMADLKESTENGHGGAERSKELFSFKHDYAYILAGFMRDYHIDLNEIKYMHWWKFRALFDGLSEDTEIMQRIKYRAVDLATIKDKEERKRICKIQQIIKLPEEELTDYEIGDMFGQ